LNVSGDLAPIGTTSRADEVRTFEWGHVTWTRTNSGYNRGIAKRRPQHLRFTYLPYSKHSSRAASVSSRSAAGTSWPRNHLNGLQHHQAVSIEAQNSCCRAAPTDSVPSISWRDVEAVRRSRWSIILGLLRSLGFLFLSCEYPNELVLVTAAAVRRPTHCQECCRRIIPMLHLPHFFIELAVVGISGIRKIS
jgi:hypothetical protein